MNDPATYPLRGVRVLIIEDSWHVAKALTSLLTDIGMVVIGPISTIAEAERLVAEQQPKLALVDPHLKVRGAAKAIRCAGAAGDHVRCDAGAA